MKWNSHEFVEKEEEEKMKKLKDEVEEVHLKD